MLGVKFAITFLISTNITCYILCLFEKPLMPLAIDNSSKSSVILDHVHASSDRKQLSQMDNVFRCQNRSKNYLSCEGKICIPTGYDRLSVPKSKSQTNVSQIEMEFMVMDILEVNDKDFSVTVGMYIGVSWEDLPITEQIFCEKEPCYEPLNTEILSRIWQPDLYIYNLKTFNVLKVLNRFEG